MRECLRAKVALTVSAPHEVQEEMAYLSEVLMKNNCSSDES